MIFAAEATPDDSEQLTIENDALKVVRTPEGRFTLVSKASGQEVLTDGNFDVSGGIARVVDVTDKTFGAGQAIEVARADGERDVVKLFPNVPFALIQSTLATPGDHQTIVRDARPFRGAVQLGKPAEQLRTLGTGGLMAPGRDPGSYAWLAVVEPQSRNGVVFGWLTHDRGSGVVFNKLEGDTVHVGAQIDYGRLIIAPGKSENLETLAVGYFDDARLGLEAWADAIAKVYEIKLPPEPIGYCTWYSKPHGGASDEEHLVELAKFSEKELAPFGFSVVQIDDKWQSGYKRSNPSSPKKDFRTHDPDGPYPKGMKAAADNIKSLGLVPGIWFMPFAGTVGDPYFDEHLDWFVKTADGKPYDTPWGGASLDMTYPPARAHLRDIASRICRVWGFEYIKVDGLWTGTATKQLYVNSGYKEDDIGEAVFHQPEVTPIEAYRSGLKLLRESVGPDVFILGCNAPQNMRTYGGTFGLVNAMRVGPDNGAEWNRLTRGTIFGSRHYFLHGRVWYNDPDPVYVRDSIPLNHAQLICSWVALSGQLNLCSEWIPSLPPERLDILKRTMPYHHCTARPVDYFENDPPRIWLVSDTKQTPRRDVIGIFNWGEKEQSFDISMKHIGLDPDAEYDAFDYWADAPQPSIKGHVKISVPGQSCRIIAVRRKADHPQIISTSRHVTQGMIDVLDEKWDQSSKTLSGRSSFVANYPCELRITADSTPTAVEVSATDREVGVTSSFKRNGQLVRVNIESPQSRDVAWAIHFK